MHNIALPGDPPSACATSAEAADLLGVALLYAPDSATIDIEPWLNTRSGQSVIFVKLPHAQFALSTATARIAARELSERDGRPRVVAALLAACEEADDLANAFQMRSAH